MSNESRRSLIALLPIKAHSERIPGKNFRPFAGRPLFRWILDTLLAIDEFDCVVINTDAREELAAAGCFDDTRVAIRDRKPDLCGDLVSMNRILADDIEASAADAYLMTHATNPLLSPKTIRQALARYRAAANADDADSLFSVTRHQARFYDQAGRPINHDPSRLIRTQDLPPFFEENSCLYVFSANSFAATEARIGARPLMFETPLLESIDIDEPSQWRLAEALALDTQCRS